MVLFKDSFIHFFVSQFVKYDFIQKRTIPTWIKMPREQMFRGFFNPYPLFSIKQCAPIKIYAEVHVHKVYERK